MAEPRDNLNSPGLYFEPPEDDRANLQAMATILPGQFPGFIGQAPPPRGGSQLTLEDTPTFRPQQRPPMALLCVLHDADVGGEWIPLRADRYVIARNDGDIRIQQDAQISGRQHAEIARMRLDSGAFRWHLADLGSTNGTFVRVSKVMLLPGTEVLFGHTRYRFDTGQTPAEPTAPPPPAVDALMTARPGSQMLRRPAMPIVVPSVVEVTPGGDGPKISLIRDEYWLGRDPNECAIIPTDDPFVSPKHARFFKGENGRWRVENNRSRNGVWLRLTQPLPVEGTCQFLLGEQRFILKVLA